MMQNFKSQSMMTMVRDITSLKWRENEFAVPFRGQVHTSGWYSMAPWAGRIKEGLITNSAGQQIQLPATIDPPHALHGFGLDLFVAGNRPRTLTFAPAIAIWRCNG
jgi:galactose mutarotase-like enzyme